ncbi:MAG: hypothetical protein JWN94_804 [Betaproteobacteria bacterium]|nr:hypothetical protein [Betaproteobacteria bacterium]
MEKISYPGFGNCYRIANDIAEIVVSTDIGPRILRYALIGGENVLGEYPLLQTMTEWGSWKPWGGHRLWAAPEAMPATYSPDNAPVKFDAPDEWSIHLAQDTDRSGLQKEMVIALDIEDARVDVHHTIINRTNSPVELAPWAITVMRSGEAIVPLEPWRSHDEALLPAQPIVRWSFTDFTDPRWTLGRRYVRVHTDAARNEPQKIGLLNKRGWCAHLHARTLFVKRFDYLDGAVYPDHGCNNEIYVEGDYLELESLGPLASLAPGESARHIEHWQLFKDVDLGNTEAEADAALGALLLTLS